MSAFLAELQEKKKCVLQFYNLLQAERLNSRNIVMQFENYYPVSFPEC